MNNTRYKKYILTRRDIRTAMAIARWLMGALCACLLHSGSGSQEIIQKLTTGFGKALDQCKAELNLGDHILQDFMNYWREEYDLLNSDMGCAIMCMASKHDLITEDMKLHHEKTHEFAKNHGADDELAKQLVQIIHGCEKQVSVDVTDDCLKTLEIAKCFRTKIHELKWAPSMETILEEVMADI